MTNIYTNPANGFQEKTDNFIFLWYLLFGSFYLMYKGIWGWAIITAILAIATYGISHLIFVFFARKIVEKNYSEKGWTLSN